MAKTKKNESPSNSILFSELAARYLAHLEENGTSASTRACYANELRLVEKSFGEGVPLAALSRDNIALFNVSREVTTLRSGKPKSQLSIDKTRRVLRMALTWAHESGIVAEPMCDAKKDELRNDDAAAPTKAEKTVRTGKAKGKTKRASKRVELEVSQEEATAAADAIEPIGAI